MVSNFEMLCDVMQSAAAAITDATAMVAPRSNREMKTHEKGLGRDLKGIWKRHELRLDTGYPTPRIDMVYTSSVRWLILNRSCTNAQISDENTIDEHARSRISDRSCVFLTKNPPCPCCQRSRYL